MSSTPREIDTADMPQWCKVEINGYTREARKRPKCFYVITDEAVVPANWHDANVRDIIIKAPDPQTQAFKLKRISDHGYENAINDPLGAYFGFRGDKLPPGGEILVIDHYPPRATLFTREIKLAGGEQLAPPLTDRERAILLIVQSTISSYRQEYFRKMRATDDEFTGLIEKGLLNKKRAITLAGRKIVEQIRAEPGRRLFDAGDALRALGLSVY